MSAGRPRPKPEIVIDWDTLDRALADGLEDLLVQDYEELEDDQGEVPLAVDYAQYRRMERMGILKSLTVRKAGKLVGYAVFVVMPPLHHKLRAWAVGDAIWLAPDERKGMTGARLVKEAIRRFREMGVQKLVIRTKVDLPEHPSRAKLSGLLRALAFKHTEDTWELML